MAMDDDTRKLLESGSLLRALGKWLISHPTDARVTFIDRFNALVSRLAMLLTAVAVIITFYEVVMRYVFFSPTLWVNELTLWIGSVIFLVAGVYTMQRRSHIRITAAYDLMSTRLQVFCDVLATLVVVAYAAMMIVAGFDVAWKTLVTWERFGTFWNPPIPATVKPLVLIATALVAVQAVNNLLIDSLPRLWRGNGSEGEK